MSIYIEKALNEAKKTERFVVVCVENQMGKGLLSNDEIFRKVSLNFVPYTTSVGTEGFEKLCTNYFSKSPKFLELFKPDSNNYDNLKGNYIIINPEHSEIETILNKNPITEFDLLGWLQSYLDSKNGNKNKKQHSRGQRFPKPKQNPNTKGVEKHVKQEFHLTPQTHFEEVKIIKIQFVTPEGKMTTLHVNKDRKIEQFLKTACKEFNLDINKLNFTYDARKINLSQTVRGIHLQNNCVVYSQYKQQFR